MSQEVETSPSEQEQQINHAVVGERVVLDMGRPIAGLKSKQSLFSKLMAHIGQNAKKNVNGRKTVSRAHQPSSITSIIDELGGQAPAKKKPTAIVFGGVVAIAALGIYQGFGLVGNDHPGTPTVSNELAPVVISSHETQPATMAMPAETVSAKTVSVAVVPEDVLQKVQVQPSAPMPANESSDNPSRAIEKNAQNISAKPVFAAAEKKTSKPELSSASDKSHEAPMDIELAGANISDDLLSMKEPAKVPPSPKLAKPLEVKNGADDEASEGHKPAQLEPMEEKREQEQIGEEKASEPSQKPVLKKQAAEEKSAVIARKSEPKTAKEPTKQRTATDKKIDKKPMAAVQKAKSFDDDDLSGFALPIRELHANGRPVASAAPKASANYASVDEQRLAKPRPAARSAQIQVIHVETGMALVTNPATHLPMRVTKGDLLPNGERVTHIDTTQGLIVTNNGTYGMN